VAPHAIAVTPLKRRIGTATKLFAVVTFSGGLPTREVRSPLQGPTFQGIRVALNDSNGDGTFDSLRFTARKGTKKVSRILFL
jgi:hypothetical protein